MNTQKQIFRDKIQELEGPIFVFGASGFIGANLFSEIFEVRKDCFAITHDSVKAWRLKLLNIPFENTVHCDITSKISVKNIFNKYQPGTIFNLAAYGAYSKQSDPNLIFETNVIGTINILENCRNHEVYIHAGTSSEYGSNSAGPSESSTLLPNSHYAVSKVSASYLIQYYSEYHDVKAINLRLYSVYGEWEEPDRLIPKLIENARKGQLPNLVSPEISRDFIYVGDAVESFIDASLHISTSTVGQSYNIGGGKKTSLRELVDTAIEEFDLSSKPEWGTMPDRGWDLNDWYGNPEKAKTDLGWEPKTGLIEGLRRTYEWQEKMKYEEVVLPAFDIPQLNPIISAVIACYQDAQAIPIMYDRLVAVFNEIKVRYEIIFVNDSSPDDTEEVLNVICAKDPNVISITHSRNFGSQSAFISGMEISTGDAVVLLDGDLQDPPEIIAEFYKKWLEGYEIVYGNRVKRETSFFLNLLYRTFYRLFRKISYVDIPVDAGDFSMIDRKVVKELVSLPETEQFLRGLRAWVGFKQIGVDYNRPERMFGVSTNNWKKNFWWAKKAIFSFSFAPLELMTLMGFILTGVSFLALGLLIIARIVYPTAPHGITSIMVMILFFGGIQLLAISFIGEYISKIFEETKKRPKFIRRSITHDGRVYKNSEQIGNFVNQRK